MQIGFTDLPRLVNKYRQVLLVPEVCRVGTETTIDMSHGYTDTYGMLDGMRVLQILVPAWLICASPGIHAEIGKRHGQGKG